MFKEILYKIRQSYWVKSVTIVFGTRMLMIILGFISFLFLIRSLDKEHYGIWVIFVTVTGLIETVRIGFIKNPMMILNSDPSIDKKKLYNSSFLLNIGLTFLIIICILITIQIGKSLFDDKIIRTLFYVYIVKLIFLPISDHIDIVQETNLEFKGTFLDLLLRNFVFVVCIGYCFIFNIQIPFYYLVLFQIAGVILGSIFSYLNSVKKQIVVFSEYGISFLYTKKLIDLGKFTFGSSVSSIAIRNVDTWILAILVNPSAVAIYNPAIRISNIFEIPSSSMTTIIMPKLAHSVKVTGLNSVKYYYERSMSYVLVFMIPIIILGVIFSDTIVQTIAGEGFEQTSYLLKFTMFYGLLIPFYRQFSITIDALGKPKLNFIITLITLVLSVVLNAAFITLFGIIGVIYATLGTYSMVFIYTQIYLYRNFEISLIGIFVGIIPSYVVAYKKIRDLLRG